MALHKNKGRIMVQKGNFSLNRIYLHEPKMLFRKHFPSSLTDVYVTFIKKESVEMRKDVDEMKRFKSPKQSPNQTDKRLT